MITVGIADRDFSVRRGIRNILNRARNISVITEAGSAPAAIDVTSRHRPRVLLLDSRMAAADGGRVVRSVRESSPTTAVVLLASPPADGHIDRALRAGVAGCLLKEGNARELVAAVMVAASDGAILSPVVARRLLERVAQIDTDRVDRARELVGVLTAREREVLELVGKGMGNNEIGRALFLSEGGVKAHVSRMLTKLHCNNRVSAAIIAHDAQLATDPGL
jgi:DNA-binding NarL/FixJ family response regulator